jgi:hypothetical protein
MQYRVRPTSFRVRPSRNDVHKTPMIGHRRHIHGQHGWGPLGTFPGCDLSPVHRFPATRGRWAACDVYFFPSLVTNGHGSMPMGV